MSLFFLYLILSLSRSFYQEKMRQYQIGIDKYHMRSESFHERLSNYSYLKLYKVNILLFECLSCMLSNLKWNLIGLKLKVGYETNSNPKSTTKAIGQGMKQKWKRKRTKNMKYCNVDFLCFIWHYWVSFSSLVSDNWSPTPFAAAIWIDRFIRTVFNVHQLICSHLSNCTVWFLLHFQHFTTLCFPLHFILLWYIAVFVFNLRVKDIQNTSMRAVCLPCIKNSV